MRSTCLNVLFSRKRDMVGFSLRARSWEWQLLANTQLSLCMTALGKAVPRRNQYQSRIRDHISHLLDSRAVHTSIRVQINQPGSSARKQSQATRRNRACPYRHAQPRQLYAFFSCTQRCPLITMPCGGGLSRCDRPADCAMCSWAKSVQRLAAVPYIA